MEPGAGAEEFRRFERDGWARAGKAGLYDRHFARLTDLFAGITLDRVRIEPGSRVLDMGCGPGTMAAEAARRGATVVGVDGSAEMVDLAAALHPEVAFQVADAEDPGFDESSFDVVAANFLLQHLADPGRALGAFARLLRPGGRLGTANWIFSPRDSLTPQAAFMGAVADTALRPVHPLPAAPDLVVFDEPSRFAQLLGAAGFTEVTSEEVAIQVHMTAEEVWGAFTRGAVRSAALTDGQPEEVTRSLRQALERRLEPVRDGEGHRLTMIATVATATRA